jgi:hypothetical protein
MPIRILGRSFVGPLLLSELPAVFRPGLYAIFAAPLRGDALPDTSELIDVGEAECIMSELNWEHPHASEWERIAEGRDRVYVAYHANGSLSDEQRRNVVSVLRMHYDPACGKMYRSVV